MPKRMMLCLCFALTGCAAATSERPDPPAGETNATPSVGETCVIGTLTNEGVECPAMQTLGGEVYTLLGDLQGHDAGDLVCACGAAVELSTCMQGTTLELTRIGSPALCP